MADLPQALDLLEEWLVGYADNVALWASHQDPDVVKKRLAKHAADFARFAAERGLVLNASKTQLMWAGNRRVTACITVDGIDIEPSNSLELLSRSISTIPYQFFQID